MYFMICRWSDEATNGMWARVTLWRIVNSRITVLA